MCSDVCDECQRPLAQCNCDAEYAKGVADAKRYQQDKQMFGEELAEQWEIEREMREAWDY